MRLDERFAITRPLEEMELALVRATLADRRLLDPHEEALLRTAISVARLYRLRQDGRDVGVGAWLTPYRQEVERRLRPVLLPKDGKVRRELLKPHLRELGQRTAEVLAGLQARFADRLSAHTIDHEVRHKSLVLVLGGGGGTVYPYLGAFAVLDEYGLVPKLMVGASMGAVLGLFRARTRRFEQDEFLSIVRSLSWRKLFRVVSTESRYGVPAALRLYLRSGIGRWFGVDSTGGEGPALKDLPIPTIVAVSGVNRGRLPHPLEFYERLIAASPKHLLDPRVLPKWLSAIAELVVLPGVLSRLHLGATDETASLDALDAAGFSCALPGIIHYDVLRDGPAMHAQWERLLAGRGLSRLLDGGLVDNVPSKAAWRAVHKGRLGTRNALVVALNAFSMKLTTPLWLPLERVAEINVAKNRPYAHLQHDFKRTLGPLVIVPTMEQLVEAMALGRRAMAQHVPLISRLLAPLPRLAEVWPAA